MCVSACVTNKCTHTHERLEKGFRFWCSGRSWCERAAGGSDSKYTSRNNCLRKLCHAETQYIHTYEKSIVEGWKREVVEQWIDGRLVWRKMSYMCGWVMRDGSREARGARFRQRTNQTRVSQTQSDMKKRDNGMKQSALEMIPERYM